MNRKDTLLLFILFLGIFLRIFYLGHQPIWIDEAGSILLEGRNPFFIWQNQALFPNPPLYFTLLHYWMRYFGNSLFAGRFLSALAGIFSIFLIFVLGKRFFSTRIGLLAALFMAISPFHIYYSQEARCYSWLVFLILLSSYFFLRASNKDKTLYWIGYVISITAAFYMHNYAIFPFLAHFVYFLFFRNNRSKKFFWASGAIFILWFYRFYVFAKQLNLEMDPWIPILTLDSLLRSLQHYVLLSWRMPMTPIVKISLYLLMPLSGFLVLKGIVNGIKSYPANKGNLFLFINLFFCTIIPVGISLFLIPIYCPGRYEIIGLPFFILLLSLGINSFRKYSAKGLVIVFIVCLTLVSLPAYYFIYQKSNSKHIAEFIKDNIKKKDVLVFTNLFVLPINYYLPKSPRYLSYPENIPGTYLVKEALEADDDYINLQINIIKHKIEKIIKDKSNIWLFYGEEPYMLNRMLLSKLKQSFNLKRMIKFPQDEYTHYFRVNKCYVFGEEGK